MRLPLQHAEGAGAAHEHVQAPVVEAFQKLLDLDRAADLAQAVVREPQDPELTLALEAPLDHGLVALLEHMQRNELTRKRDGWEQKEWKFPDGPVGHP